MPLLMTLNCRDRVPGAVGSALTKTVNISGLIPVTTRGPCSLNLWLMWSLQLKVVGSSFLSIEKKWITVPTVTHCSRNLPTRCPYPFPLWTKREITLRMCAQIEGPGTRSNGNINILIKNCYKKSCVSGKEIILFGKVFASDFSPMGLFIHIVVMLRGRHYLGR